MDTDANLEQKKLRNKGEDKRKARGERRKKNNE